MRDETQTKGHRRKETAGMVGKGSQKKRKCWLLKETPSMLAEQSLKEWLSSSEELCGKHDFMMEYLCIVFRIEILQNFHLQVSEILRSQVTQYSSGDEVYSHSLGPSGKKKRVSLLKTALLEACKGILAHVKEANDLLKLHVNFAKKVKTEQLSRLLTVDGLRAVLGRVSVMPLAWPFLFCFVYL